MGGLFSLLNGIAPKFICIKQRQSPRQSSQAGLLDCVYSPPRLSSTLRNLFGLFSLSTGFYITTESHICFRGHLITWNLWKDCKYTELYAVFPAKTASSCHAFTSLFTGYFEDFITCCMWLRKGGWIKRSEPQPGPCWLRKCGLRLTQ